MLSMCCASFSSDFLLILAINQKVCRASKLSGKVALTTKCRVRIKGAKNHRQQHMNRVDSRQKEQIANKKKVLNFTYQQH